MRSTLPGRWEDLLASVPARAEPNNDWPWIEQLADHQEVAGSSVRLGASDYWHLSDCRRHPFSHRPPQSEWLQLRAFIHAQAMTEPMLRRLHEEPRLRPPTRP
ncbi:MAG: hypothetical protein RMJ19_07455 [Gemmatales bacterium]|nr:hypothetical protein [Gemmatales bacterium]MDW8175492.1 hypothetical protein [Gemmatales bacterium]MDW8224218.1 hypothetical protein [Gemmatales bacterium]